MNISEPMSDVELADTIRRGIELTNAVFDIQLPTLGEASLDRLVRSQSQLECAENFFESLTDEMARAQDLGRTEDDYIALNASIGLPPIDLEQIGREAYDLSLLADEDLIREANCRFQVQRTDLKDNFDRESYAWIKINHGWWELVASQALDSRSVTNSFFRSRTFYEDSRCCDLIAGTIQRLQSRFASPTASAFVSGDTDLAISFNAGHLWNSDIAAPLPSFMRGAMIGAPSYFHVASGGAYPFTVADGAAAKKLAYEGQLAAFCRLVADWSDAVVFITPDHLKTITLVDFVGDTFNVIIPARRVHELWPSTLAYVAGNVERIIKKYSRITIFIQAAVISAPIGVLLVDLMRRRSGVRIYDFGQVLDLAEPVGRRTKKWARDLEDYPQFADAHLGCFTFR